MHSITTRFMGSGCYYSLSKQRTSGTTRQFDMKPKSSLSLASMTHYYEPKRSKMKISTTEIMETKSYEVFDAYDDEYGGAVIDPQCLPNSANAFVAIFQSSLAYWKIMGKKGIWLKILKEQADLVPIALKEGFCYHHAEQDYVMLTFWIPDTPCMLPHTATHQVGIGAFVINDNEEILVVKEKNCPLICSGIWKMPTGLINKGEEISVGAIREVKEETGIDTTFSEVVAFRHAHNVMFEKSDLFFVCMLNARSLDITVDELEIKEAKWMPLNEFKNQAFHREDEMLRSIVDICIARYEERYHGFTANAMMSKFDDRMSYVYCGDIH